jgi:hypothetical protein
LNIQILFVLLFAIVKLIVCLLNNTGQHVPRTRYRTRQVPDTGRFENVSAPPTLRSQRGREPSIHLDKVIRGLNGELVESPDEQWVTFRRKNYHYRLHLKQGLDSISIRVVSNWPETDFRMRLFPDEHHGVVNKIFYGTEDIDIGDRGFDLAFVLQSNSRSRLKNVLDTKVRKMITSYRRHAHRRIAISISAAEIEFGGTANSIMAHQQIIAIAKNFAEIHRLMLLTLDSRQPIEMTFIERTVSTCMVCGDSVGGRPHDTQARLELGSGHDREEISCASCETDYHRDCWEYIGKCSTYGCRSRRHT